MKTKIIFSFCIAVSAVVFLFLKPEAGVNSSPVNLFHSTTTGNNFIIGAMDCGYDRYYNIVPDLKLNLWHKYTGIIKLPSGSWWTNFGWDWWNGQNCIDQVEAEVSTYQSVITTQLTGNHNHGLRTLMDRPKFQLLCLGQRSDYECEEEHLDPDLWFYAFNLHGINGLYGRDEQDFTYGQGEWVRRCMKAPLAFPGWAVSGLRANNEQVNTYNTWPGDKMYAWYVKPRIRADEYYVDHHNNEPICRIDVINYKNETIKSVEIRARNFKDQYNEYDGRYLDEFNFNIQLNDSTLKFEDWQAINFNPDGDSWPFSANGYGVGACKVDFRIWWYAVCDIWVDRIRVESDVAYNLLNPGAPNHNRYNGWLTDEINLACNDQNYPNNPFRFYVEEFEFNHLPCLTYVNNKIKAISQPLGKDLSMMCDLNYLNYNAHLPWSEAAPLDAGHVKRTLIDKAGMAQIFGGSYPLQGSGSWTGYVSKIPNTLPTTSGGQILATPVYPLTYDTWLQDEFDFQHGSYSFSNQLKMLDAVSKSSGKPYYDMFQAHQHVPGSYNWREPTNEELAMMANVIVTYGAKGILYFVFGSYYNSPTDYGYGLCNIDWSRRIDNVYNQWQNGAGSSKFGTVAGIGDRLKKWEPALVSFDNTNSHSYIYRLEYETVNGYTIFNDVLPYAPDLKTRHWILTRSVTFRWQHLSIPWSNHQNILCSLTADAHPTYLR